MKVPSILSLTPHISYKIWGGSRISKIKNITDSSGSIGETWEISIHQSGPSLVGKNKLSDYILPHQLPYLVKLIDTQDNLSIQVHPEGVNGKSECWLVLDSEVDSGVFLGLKENVSRDSFVYAIKNNLNVSEFLQFHKVSRGDFLFVPPGTIHSIGKGVFLLEVQQNSDITYRLWDWNRVDSKGNRRKLNIDKGLEVALFDWQSNNKLNFRKNSNIFENEKIDLISHEYFSLTVYNLDKGERIKLPVCNNNHLSSMMVLEGDVICCGGDVVKSAKSYDSLLFMSHNNDDIEIEFKSYSSIALIY